MKSLSAKKITKAIINLLEVLLGNLIYACTIQFFVGPTDIIMGGATGIALFLEDNYGVSMSAFLMAFNIVMLIVGLIFLGKKFAMTTVVSSFAYPIFIELLDRLFGNTVPTTDPFLCTIFAGLGIGIGLGLVFRAGSSTGGMDVPPILLNKYLKIPISVGMNGFDIIIIMLQLFASTPESLMYGIVVLIIYTIVLDKMILLGSSKTEIKVISPRAHEICTAILTQLGRGVTYLNGRSGYLNSNTEVVLSVVTNRELPRIEKLIHAIDPNCFMIVTRVSEVAGEGFTFERENVDGTPIQNKPKKKPQEH